MPWLGRGRNSLNVAVSIFPLSVDMITFRFGLNSAKDCRQAPQGTVGCFESVTTAISTNSRSPSATAAQIAACSAQLVRRKEMFSTLQPLNTRPDFVRSAAPTKNLE